MNDSNLFLTLSLDPSSVSTSYQQLVEQFKTMILKGDLPAGEKVPSSRELAKSLGSSRTTTIKSYDILISEGFLIAKPKQGVFVAECLPTLQLELSQSSPADTDTLVLKSDFEEVKPIQLGAGADVAVFPNKAWASSMRRSWLKPDEKLMHGHYTSGLPALKAHLVTYLKDLRGLECEADQIIITSGNRDALSILTHALIDQHKVGQQSVWLENPCFPGISNFFTWLGVNLQSLKIDEEGTVLPNLAEAAPVFQSKQSHIALITPNRQYPLGKVMSSSRRQEWLSQLAISGDSADRKLWLIEDDYDNEFLYQGRMGVPLMNLDASQSTFFVGSFSKVLFRGIRLGFIVAPKAKVQDLIASQVQLGGSASLPMQAVLADFISTGDFAAHLRRMRRHYLDKRNYVSSLLNKQLSMYFTYHKPSGGMHTLLYFKPHWIKRHESILQVKNGTLVKKLDLYIEQCLQKRHITITSLSSQYFSTDQSTLSESKEIQVEQGFVLGFSQSSKETLKMALEILMQQTRNHFL